MSELKASHGISPEEESHCKSLTGMLRWFLELDMTDTCLEMSMMDSHACSPMEDHLKKVYHMFECLKKCRGTELVLDLSSSDADTSGVEFECWATCEFGHVLERDEEPEKRANLTVTIGVGLAAHWKVGADCVVGAVSEETGRYSWSTRAVLLRTSSVINKIVLNKVPCDLYFSTRPGF